MTPSLDSHPLIEWFLLHGRTYPWRATKDPYLILVAAFMLQRTGASQVMNVYPTFVSRYPSLHSLSGAESGDLADTIRPLGRLNRLPQLTALARALVEKYDGTVPEDLNALEDLPGIGQYSARSVMCLAFGAPYITLDPNSYRVLSRAWAYVTEKTRPHADRKLIAALDAVVPREDPKSFNLALLDLGSMVCKNRVPQHESCPLADSCALLKGDRSGCSVCS